MQNISLASVMELSFRANPCYELVLYDHLPSNQKEILRELDQDPDFYGILQPQEQSGLGIKSVCRDTALLYFTLQHPGRLPAYVRELFGEQCIQAIAQLVLDDVLEVERDGTFVSGSDASGLFRDGGSIAGDRKPLGKIARLSVQALQYAQALDIRDVIKLSARLYFYNRWPASPYWHSAFSTPNAVANHLKITSTDSSQSILERNWSRVSPPPPYDGWLTWASRTMPSRSQNNDVGVCKLYISPECRHIRDAFHTTVEVLTDSAASRFKIGKDIYGLLRPDKIVAYFGSFEEMEATAHQLAHKLEDCPAHGVPFTVEIAGDGLLSWGVDPPRKEQGPNWYGPESWRLWITNRLATSMLAAKQSRTTPLKTDEVTPIEPWQFALERLRLEGVDTETWTPANMTWC
ncbi:hypothetical protein KFU94_15130 [Chloroflexi bacterium TSY]|nr:hypothetical protein [Chloroflexi bacterium TSY]